MALYFETVTEAYYGVLLGGVFRVCDSTLQVL